MSLGFHKQVLFCLISYNQPCYQSINQSITDESASAGTVTSSSQSIVPSVSCRVLNPGLRNRGCRSTDWPGPSQSPVSYLPTGSSSDHVEFRVISFIWPAFNLFITRAAREYLGKHSFSGADPTSRNQMLRIREVNSTKLLEHQAPSPSPTHTIAPRPPVSGLNKAIGALIQARRPI